MPMPPWPTSRRMRKSPSCCSGRQLGGAAVGARRFLVTRRPGRCSPSWPWPGTPRGSRRPARDGGRCTPSATAARPGDTARGTPRPAPARRRMAIRTRTYGSLPIAEGQRPISLSPVRSGQFREARHTNPTRKRGPYRSLLGVTAPRIRGCCSRISRSRLIARR